MEGMAQLGVVERTMNIKSGSSLVVDVVIREAMVRMATAGDGGSGSIGSG